LNEVKISPITQNDIEAIVLLEEKCFSVPWSYSSLQFEIANENSIFLCAKKNEEVLGYAGMHIAADEGYIDNIAVFEKHRKKGIASFLINELIDYALIKKLAFISLEVRISNLPAIKLYNKFGFIKAGIRKGFYEFPKEDAVIMTKKFI
jgi:ribosomal-protein-alanine acetyltransferase